MKVKLAMAASLAALGAAGAQEAETRYYPGEPGWASRFAVDVVEAPLGGLDQARTPLPAPAAPARYAVTFKGEVAGLDVGRVLLDVTVSDEAYDLSYEMQQKGVAKFFSDAEAEARAAGTFGSGGGIDGTYYFNHDYESEDDQQRVELYRPKGARRLRLWADPAYWFHDPVPEAMALGATDPLGALVALGFPEAAPGRDPCERTARVFDGRRRFDLTMTPQGLTRLKAGGNGRYEGPAYECRMTLAKVAGYRPKDRAEMEGSVWVYLAPVPEAARSPAFAYVPVRVRARQGVLGASLEAKFPTITAPDGTVIRLYEE